MRYVMISQVRAWLHWFFFTPRSPAPVVIDEFAIRLAAHKCKPDPREVARTRLTQLATNDSRWPEHSCAARGQVGHWQTASHTAGAAIHSPIVIRP